MPHDVIVLVGSLRKGSITRKVARTLVKLEPPSLKCELIEFNQLQHYNADLEENLPSEWVTFRDRTREFLKTFMGAFATWVEKFV